MAKFIPIRNQVNDDDLNTNTPNFPNKKTLLHEGVLPGHESVYLNVNFMVQILFYDSEFFLTLSKEGVERRDVFDVMRGIVGNQNVGLKVIEGPCDDRDLMFKAGSICEIVAIHEGLQFIETSRKTHYNSMTPVLTMSCGTNSLEKHGSMIYNFITQFEFPNVYHANLNYSLKTEDGKTSADVIIGVYLSKVNVKKDVARTTNLHVESIVAHHNIPWDMTDQEQEESKGKLDITCPEDLRGKRKRAAIEDSGEGRLTLRERFGKITRRFFN